MDGSKSVPLQLNPLTVIIIFCFSLTLVPLFYQFENVEKAEEKVLKLPQCQDEETVETIIDFFVYQSVWSAYGEDKITKRINSAINTANRVLKNSCIPMRRRLGKLYPVDMKFKSLVKINVGGYHNELLHEVEPTIVEYIHTQPNRYYALITDGLPENLVGVTHPYYPQFLILSIRADKYVLEHELGHLANAEHRGSKLSVIFERLITPEANKDKLHSYARGYNCGRRRTIMSTKPSSYSRLPVYSSPEIFYGGDACGDLEYGDNARRLREYAYQLREKLKSR
ncbi:hypothetical protein ACFL53_03815 [Pseudomonadota bacterium]